MRAREAAGFAAGAVRLEASPLNGPPASFHADVGSVASYGPSGFTPSIITFGRAGCWVLRAHLDASVLRVVAAVSAPRR